MADACICMRQDVMEAAACSEASLWMDCPSPHLPPVLRRDKRSAAGMDACIHVHEYTCSLSPAVRLFAIYAGNLVILRDISGSMVGAVPTPKSLAPA